ncbi:DUF2442 domain-containing protein [Mucispirillum schaedleri]|uniref:DUF2442 domain-containing protein n=1 Tax=Mucispirillum schaedleri TaxID=248039 RepID=UPI001F586584|nr:DUF2442 domain-containing protein [Mucispirillum schaedleri]
MIIIDGICYADNFKKVLEVTSVSALDDYQLRVTFSTNEIKIFDFKPLLIYPAFVHLKDPVLFVNCYVDTDFGAVCWDENTDIATERLYQDGYAE